MEFESLILTFIVALIITPLIKKLAIKIGAVDQPSGRKVHQKVMPRLGGLAIYLSFMIGMIFFYPDSVYTIPILIGGTIIVITGMLDDLYELSPKWKLLGQILAAVVVLGSVQVEFINLPFGGQLYFGMFSIPITIIWIVAITNAINLIDGLDGLAAGVSSIALLTISSMSIIMGNDLVMVMGFMLLGSTVAFLFYNFYPAKIFMGDTGALFLGYMIGVFSLLGFKNVTVFSFIIPIVILGVPISDTIFAMIRRKLQGKPISAPDKSHLHHRLLQIGFSHPLTVLLIYVLSGIFSLAAVLFTKATMWGSLLLTLVLFLIIELVVELTGLISKNYRPLLNFVKKGFDIRRY
ncbi:glycosyltransferase family 4 protein [Tenuibacillus multivorans]|uniref:UDP-GlcNAc:undecaprenyl-phosphate GlcNAc-1-phosphate transferase n=1 Tax=Tenuibacillus multivorans TaxID=237069 RepID=A0A1H0G6D7_9BACI|nr:MraY family glycosyltransferase [Tenuibacillus multivorans]GEL78725.1 undecaprenyl-phosphate alpha-N-acetylglucosaminyl 1-phosphate transferase [Tenuibacillus multivorans]SDO02432.1 UDP-GlcNAc:undecaprenyl-phosphate GlcNAc-1-phosphate transferase [Tenuibacillus multivorans]